MKESQLVKDVKDAIRARGGRPIKYHGSCYSEAGVPDILTCYRGFFIWIETKKTGETSTPIQRTVQKELDDAGARGCEVFEVCEAMALLDMTDRDLGFKPEHPVSKEIMLRVVKRIFEERKIRG